ncbi:MAG: hypothetical protein ACRDTU_00430 [Micromonosporaceae bacterium]
MHPSQPPQPPEGYPPSPQQPTTAYPVMGTPATPPPGGQFPGTVHGRKPRRDLRVRLGDALAAGGALLVVLFSFAPFIGYTDSKLIDALEKEDLPTWFSAWGLETFLAPLSWWVIFAALGVIGLVAARVFGNWDRELLGFRPSQIKVALGLFCGIVLLGYALSAKTLVYGAEFQDEEWISADISGDMTFGWGGLLMLLGAIVAATGAVLDHLNVGPEVWPLPQRPQQPQQPYGHPQPGHPQQPGYPPAAGQPAGYPQPGAAPHPGAAQHPPAGQAVYQTTYPGQAYQATQAYPQQPPSQPQPGGPATGGTVPSPRPEQPAAGEPVPPPQPGVPQAEPSTGTEQPPGGAANGDQRPEGGTSPS